MYTTSGDPLIICENSGTFTMVMSTLTMYEKHVSTFEHYLVQAWRKQIRSGTAVQMSTGLQHAALVSIPCPDLRALVLLRSYGANLYLCIV